MIILLFQHTAARRRLHAFGVINTSECNVSTHSRTKAAAYLHFSCATSRISFNTQPHEGGCLLRLVAMLDFCRFQHTAARRRLPLQVIDFIDIFLFQHTAARRRLPLKQVKKNSVQWFQHTAARRRLLFTLNMVLIVTKFQHTAARRRLLPT